MAEEPEARALLYGADPAAGLVGLAPSGEGAQLWWRRDGGIAPEREAFHPFFLTSHPQLLDDFKPEPEITALDGTNLYSHRVSCDGWAHCDAALKHMVGYYRQHRSEFEYEPYLRFTDEVNQYLLASGRTHYQELDLRSLRVLYLALRAVAGEGADYADPSENSDTIVMVGLSDGREFHQLCHLDGSEQALIERVGEEISSFDPDVIVGHDLFKGALSYLAARARRHGVKLKLGRDQSAMTIRKSRAPAAEKQLEYPRADVAGRSLVDTWFLAQYYDVVKRDLARYDAPYVARYLDETCQLPDPVPAWDVEHLWQSKRQLLVADIRYELDAARIVFQMLGGSYFAQAQMLPLSLQDCVVRGNGVKINNLLLREYLRRGESIPAPVEGRSFIGGYTDIRMTGLIHDVLNVDIASLYPSIMLSHGVKPATDTGDVFQPLLSELTSQRLAAKQLARDAEDAGVRVRADARQAAFKIFINSFFGYLGTNRMNWADPRQAEFITTTGQELVKQLAQLVEDEGGKVIEIDTDGVYFTAPEGCAAAEQHDELVARINDRLPAGITVELGGYFPAMLSHKVKNYALLDEHGRITVKGSGLKSRGLEPFLHDFISFSLAAILHGQPQRIGERHRELARKIEGRTINIALLARTDTLIESLDTYRAKVEAGSRNRAAAYEVALRASRPLRPGDQVSYYVTGEKITVKAFEAAKPLRQYDPQSPDYNVKYYLKKLDQNLKKIRGYLGDDEQSGLFDEE